ncbi:hypothetical protein L7F22_006730 [Adiantum nelumboides]|nr:hypothetical protein [Adiantum nelumboides]
MSGQTQFRYTQTPSKVLHLRNLPWECGEEELIDLCKPFGKVVNTKCCVGANRNQAFVEFSDQNQAISMVSYYASSSEPAQVLRLAMSALMSFTCFMYKGYWQTTTLWEKAHVFSAFGFVHKIATFEKMAGFQALVQFTDADTASQARTALDGRSIPRYLLAEHVGPCHLRISFSAHTDLNVKFQSHRSRDYTNLLLPVAPSAMDGGQFTVGPDGNKREPESNVLLASIENMQYAVTIEVLQTIFAAFGTVLKIAMFEKNAGLQALVQYADLATAVTAKEALEGHCIYEGGYCKLYLSYSRHTDLNVKGNTDRSRDYTLPSQASLLGQQPIASGYGSPASYTGSPFGGVPSPYDSTQGIMSPGLLTGHASSPMYGVPPSPADPQSPGGVPPYQGGLIYGSPPPGLAPAAPQYGPSLPNTTVQEYSQHSSTYVGP